MAQKRSRSVSTASTTTSDEESSESDSQEIASGPNKYVQLDEPTSTSSRADAILCQLPPHDPFPFSSIADFESHYQKEHVHRCIECQKNLPSDHFLALHIAENHDPLSEIRRERGEKTYSCLVEDCERVCSTPFKRRLHLIDKHHFPRNYDFFIVNDGIDNRTTMLRLEPTSKPPKFKPGPKATPMLRQKPTSFAVSSSTVQEKPVNIDDVTNSMKALQFVPSSVRNARNKNSGESRRRD